MRIAVIGAGISGIAAADALSESAEVTLYEADPRLGGHTDSHTVLLSDQVYSVDTGFVAFNGEYPLFSSWLEKLGVSSQPAQMSLSVSCWPQRLNTRLPTCVVFFHRSRLFRPMPSISC